MVPAELEWNRALELPEAAAWADFYLAASDEAIHQNEIALHRFGSAVASIAGRADVLTYNRVVGLGMDEPLDDGTIEAIIAAFADSGAKRFFVHLSPAAVDRGLASRLTARGFRHHNNWMKLHRNVQPPPPGRTDLRLKRIGADQADAFANVFVSSFDWPQTLVSLVAAPVGRKGWHHYIGYDGERAMATAAMFVWGKTAWLDFAATLPEARGRGAQSALIRRRIEDCLKLGCDMMVVETAEETPDKPAPSFRNVRRFGFQVAYARANYIMEF